MGISPNNTTKACAAGVVLAVLGACSSSSGVSVDTVSRDAQSDLGVIPATLEIDYDEVADQITITDGANTRIADRITNLDTTGFSGYANLDVGPVYLNLGETSSGSGSAGAGSSPDGTTPAFSGSIFERSGDTVMPTSGTANYTGNYVAWMSTQTNFDAIYLIVGASSFDVDFVTGLIDGMITDRNDSYRPFITLADLKLEEVTFSDGAFFGTTSGGAYNDGVSTVSAGEYGGLFTGNTGQEIVGGIQVLHVNNGLALIESGAFIAE